MFLISQTSWEIKNTKEKGKGVFAKKNIPAGKIIGDYIGTVLKTAEAILPSDTEHFYLMYYHDQASLFPDLSKPGIHLLNHSCAPNCWIFIYKGHTLFFSLRKIFIEEEMTISYLLGPQEPYCKNCTHLCKCNTFLCSGSLHLSENQYKNWSVFHEKQIHETKRNRIHYNKPLPLLSTYPKTISDNPLYTLFGAEHQEPLIVHNESLPSWQKIRSMIRKSGRTLIFPKFQKTVLGVRDQEIIFSPFENS